MPSTRYSRVTPSTKLPRTLKVRRALSRLSTTVLKHPKRAEVKTNLSKRTKIHNKFVHAKILRSQNPQASSFAQKSCFLLTIAATALKLPLLSSQGPGTPSLKGRTSKGAFCLPRILSHHDCAFKGALQLCNLPHVDRSKNKEMTGPPREFRVMA